jgi:hypothetical protein
MKKLVIHPLLFAVAPVLYFLSVNKTELLLTNIYFLISLAVVLVISFLFWRFLSLLLKDSEKAAMIVSFSFFLLFSYGHFRDLLPNFKVNALSFSIGPDKAAMAFWGLLFGLIVFLIAKSRRNLSGLTKFLNVVAAALVLIIIADIVPYFWQSSQNASGPNEPPGMSNSQVLTAPENPPDIYYLIFDRYARADVLKKSYGYDNSEFINYLTEKGFYVASESFANYPRTVASLASSLNMRHLGYLADELGEDYQSKQPLYEMLQDYEVWRSLKGAGYKFIHFGDWASFTAKNRFADENVNYLGVIGIDFIDELLKKTALYPFLEKIYSPYEVNRKRFFLKLARLSELPEESGPKFVFVHMLIPHEPFVFDKDGNPITPSQVAKRSLQENYLGQVIFANQKIEEIMNTLIAKSKTPPVIILQSDEGPFPPGWLTDEESGDDWQRQSLEHLKIKTAILNAYYLPGVDTNKLLYPTITPVNSFRIVFNQYFGVSYDLLPDQLFIPAPGSLYKFIDVTGKLRK